MSEIRLPASSPRTARLSLAAAPARSGAVGRLAGSYGVFSASASTSDAPSPPPPCTAARSKPVPARGSTRRSWPRAWGGDRLARGWDGVSRARSLGGVPLLTHAPEHVGLDG